MILGVGTGDPNDPSLAQVGEVIDAKGRAAMLDEALDVLAGLWTGQPFSYNGAHYQVRDAIFWTRCEPGSRRGHWRARRERRAW